MGKGPRASSLTLSVCLSSIPCPGSIFHQLLALFLYGTCHCSSLAKLVHGSALFLWTRCPLLSPVLKLSPTWPSAGFGGGGGYCCHCLIKCHLPGTEELELRNDAFTPEALSQWDAQHANCPLEQRQRPAASRTSGQDIRVRPDFYSNTTTSKPLL